jgi:hypothetical protein
MVEVALVLAMIPNKVRLALAGGYAHSIGLNNCILSRILVTKEISKERDSKDMVWCMPMWVKMLPHITPP